MGMFGPLSMVPSTNRPITERPQFNPSRPLTDRPIGALGSFGPGTRTNVNDEIKRTLAMTRKRAGSAAA